MCWVQGEVLYVVRCIFRRGRAELPFLESFFSPGKSNDCCLENVVFAGIFSSMLCSVL